MQPRPYEEQAPTRNLAALSSDDRMQVRAERELLALMATSIDTLRPYGERIASFTWADSRHEAMAWAMLATPVGATPAEVVAAASEVVAFGTLLSILTMPFMIAYTMTG